MQLKYSHCNYSVHTYCYFTQQITDLHHFKHVSLSTFGVLERTYASSNVD